MKHSHQEQTTTENKNKDNVKEQTAICAPVLVTLTVALHVYGAPHSALHK